MKKLIFILISISLFMSCSFVTDSTDSDSTISPLVGTWNVTTMEYFETVDCSGIPSETIVLDSLEQLGEYGMDEYQIKITITLDSFVIFILTQSFDTSYVREEIVKTGIILDYANQYCVIWDTEDGEICDECRDYIVNGDVAEITSYNCPSPTSPEINIPCEIYTLAKQ